MDGVTSQTNDKVIYVPSLDSSAQEFFASSHDLNEPRSWRFHRCPVFASGFRLSGSISKASLGGFGMPLFCSARWASREVFLDGHHGTSDGPELIQALQALRKRSSAQWLNNNPSSQTSVSTRWARTRGPALSATWLLYLNLVALQVL